MDSYDIIIIFKDKILQYINDILITTQNVEKVTI